MVNNKKENKNDLTKTKKAKALVCTYRIFVVLGIIAIILLIIFKPCNCNCSCNPSNNGNGNNDTYFSTNIDDSISDGQNKKDVVADLNKQVEDGMITMSMNTEPVFKDGSSKGNLLIENDNSNKHPQVVQIYIQDSNKLIYTSGMIPVGKSIQEDNLDVNLDKGTYKCVAYFNAVDESTGKKLGTSGANIIVHIQN